MYMCHPIRSAVFVVSGCLFLFAACGDDQGTGPMFGDLRFAPSSIDIGTASETSFTLTNSGDAALGPILIGLDVVRSTTNADSLCAGAQATVTPSSVSSLAVGASTGVDVVLDLSNTNEELCPFKRYDATIAAAVSDEILGLADIFFDHEAEMMP